MAQTITYGNYLGEQITDQQFSLLDNYSIIYKEDDNVKRIEYYVNKEISQLTYYLSSNESVSSVLNDYTNSFVEIINRSTVGNYRIEESRSYDHSVLKLFSKQVYDSVGNQICDQEYDLNTNQAVLESTEKYLFENSGDDITTGFEYDQNGDIYRVWGWLVENTDRRQSGYIYKDDIADYFPNMFEEHPYYRNADLIPTLSA